MKTIIKLTLAAVILCSSFAAEAGTGRGSYRSSGYLGRTSSRNYVYRNPYAAYPSQRASGYYRSRGTYVMPYVRTSPNWTPTDNLNYRGYGTIRVPRY